MSIRIYADFNTKDQMGRVDLGIYGSKNDIDRLQGILRPGLAVILYFDDIEVDATLVYEPEVDRWYGIVTDWSTYRDNTFS